MRTSALEHGWHMGRRSSVMGSFVCLDLHHTLMSLFWHPTPAHIAFAQGGCEGKQSQ
jgi:hypothetical protein